MFSPLEQYLQQLKGQYATSLQQEDEDTKALELEKLLSTAEAGIYASKYPLSAFEKSADLTDVTSRADFKERLVKARALYAKQQQIDIARQYDAAIVAKGQDKVALEREYNTKTARLTNILASGLSTIASKAPPVAGLRTQVVEMLGGEPGVPKAVPTGQEYFTQAPILSPEQAAQREEIQGSRVASLIKRHREMGVPLTAEERAGLTVGGRRFVEEARKIARPELGTGAEGVLEIAPEEAPTGTPPGPEEVARIRNLPRGEMIRVAKALGIPRREIMGMEDLIPEMRSAPRAFTPEQFKQVRLKEIAEYTGLPKETVQLQLQHEATLAGIAQNKAAKQRTADLNAFAKNTRLLVEFPEAANLDVFKGTPEAALANVITANKGRIREIKAIGKEQDRQLKDALRAIKTDPAYKDLTGMGWFGGRSQVSQEKLDQIIIDVIKRQRDIEQKSQLTIESLGFGPAAKQAFKSIIDELQVR